MTKNEVVAELIKMFRVKYLDDECELNGVHCLQIDKCISIDKIRYNHNINEFDFHSVSCTTGVRWIGYHEVIKYIGFNRSIYEDNLMDLLSSALGVNVKTEYSIIK